jgi:hypothetical protein
MTDDSMPWISAAKSSISTVLGHRTVIAVVPPGQLLLVNAGWRLRQAIRSMTHEEAGDHPVEVWAETQENGILGSSPVMKYA